MSERDSETAPTFGIARLIDDGRQQDRAALKFTEDTLHTVLSEIGYPVVLMAADGLIVHANEATTRLIGRGVGSLTNTRYCPFLHEEDGTPVIPDLLGNVVRTGRREDRELWRFDRWWHMHLVPLRNAENEVRRVLLLAQDTTAIKAEQAAQLAREKTLTRALVREMHHRIKNHLQGLVGLLRSCVSARQSSPEVIDVAIAKILSIATVHGLLAKNGQSSIEFADLVAQIIATLQVGSAIPVHFTLQSGKGDSTALSQEEAVPLAVAIGELLTNAVKHTAVVPEAYVEGRLSHTDEGTELDISNGPARLPQGMQLSESVQSHSGLGLVHALLPRGRAELEILQEGERVTTRLRLRGPAPA